MPRLQAGEIRWWDSGRWWRGRSPTNRGRDSYCQGAQPRLLLLTADQEGCGRRCCHFLAAPEWTGHGGLKLMLDFLPGGEPYHRSWNDFKRACSRAAGRFEATTLQLGVVMNQNYNPCLKGSNMFKKREMLKDLREIAPCASAAWEELMDTFAADARVAPATSHGAAPAAYEELCLNNPNFRKKGPYVRQSAWWSFVQSAMNYDTMFSAWRYTLREVGKRLIQSGADLKALEKEALQQLHTTMGAPDGGNQPASRELHQKQLRAVRAAKGNQILLAPMLMHNLNFFNMRVFLLASRPFWSEQTPLGS